MVIIICLFWTVLPFCPLCGTDVLTPFYRLNISSPQT